MAAQFSYATIEAIAIARGGSNEIPSVATYLRISETSASKYRQRGHIGPWTADRLATNLGLHPAMVWPAWSAWVPDDRHVTRRRRLQLAR